MYRAKPQNEAQGSSIDKLSLKEPLCKEEWQK